MNTCEVATCVLKHMETYLYDQNGKHVLVHLTTLEIICLRKSCDHHARSTYEILLNMLNYHIIFIHCFFKN